MLTHLARDWGSTAEERAGTFPCDALLPQPDAVLHRAVHVAAPPAVLFRWLCQLRVAPYSYDWIDNFGRRSPRALNPALQKLARGQRVMRIFRLEDYELERQLTLVLDDPAGVSIFGQVVGTYRITPVAGGSRLVVRLLTRAPRGPFRHLHPLLPLGDLIMMRRQLLQLRSLAEGSARASLGGSTAHAEATGG